MSDNDPFAVSALDKTRQQEMNMAAPNAQPTGKRPGPKSSHQHSPIAAGQPSSSVNASQPGGGAGVVKPIKTAPTGKNKNRLH